ncbi:MAG: hypothetical protein EOO56_17250 [Hymenobacter sp.]|nr:MAG: hypothetical protein EOO56_17250 [Hymenobacter sp.]
MYWLLSLLLLGMPLLSGAFPRLAAPTAPAPLDQCRLRVRLDPRTGTVQAYGTWHIQAGSLPANLHFLLAPGLVVQAVQGSRILGFSQRLGTRSGDTLTLRLRPSGQPVAPLRFHLAYAGRVAASPLPQAIHAWSASWLELTERLGLLPLRCQVPLTQRTTYSLHVELPLGYDLVGSGRVRHPRAGHWTLHQRATRQLGLFGAPGLARWRAPSPRGLAVWVVQPGAVDTIAQRLATLAVRAATFYKGSHYSRNGKQR